MTELEELKKERLAKVVQLLACREKCENLADELAKIDVQIMRIELENEKV